MQPTKFNSQRIRQAGSLETTSRQLNLQRSTQTNVESSHQYDDLFIAPIDDTLLISDNKSEQKSTSIMRKRVDEENSSPPPLSPPPQPSSPSRHNYSTYDLDKIEVDRDSIPKKSKNREKMRLEESEKEQRGYNDSSKQEKKATVTEIANRQLSITQKTSRNHDNFTTGNNPFLIKSISLSEKPINKTKSMWLSGDNVENGDESDEQKQNINNVVAQIRPHSGGGQFDASDLPRNDLSHAYFAHMNDSIEFMFRQAPADRLVRCEVLVRTNALTTNDYEMYVEDSARDMPLLSTAVKSSLVGVYLNVSGNIIDTNTNKYRSRRIGKLRSDLGRKSYELVQVSNDSEPARVHFELLYHKMSMTNPTPKEVDLYLRTQLASSNFNHKLMTKPAEYSSRQKTYMLDFKGRAKKSSSNNMQIIESDRGEQVLWQLGKIEKNHYILDFKYPFSAFTAFGAALACLTRN